jgi:two-component system OmpR family response regulator
VLTRAQLLENVWGWDYAGESQIVETYVSYLRRKLDPLGPPLIHTQRGVGYSLRLPEHAAAHRAHQARQTWQSRDEPIGPTGGSASPVPDPGDSIDADPGRSTAAPAGELSADDDGGGGGRDEPGRRGAEPGHP